MDLFLEMVRVVEQKGQCSFGAVGVVLCELHGKVLPKSRVHGYSFEWILVDLVVLNGPRAFALYETFFPVESLKFMLTVFYLFGL